MSSTQSARTSGSPAPAPRGAVLIVEDEVLIRFALADFLRDNNFKVYEAHNGEEAIQLLSFYKTEIDVVFSDVRLPGGVDGFTLAQWVGRYRPEAAVILGTGYPIDLAGAATAALTIFVKPYDLKSVRR